MLALRTRPRLSLSGLYALTPDCADTARLVTQVRAALGGGASAIQYRNKTAAPVLRVTQAQALRDACSRQGAAFIVNDDVELADRVGADGVHLGRDDGPIAEARKRLGPQAMIGVSCYDSLTRAEIAVGGGADYIAFGSFFASTVKPGAVRAPVSLLAAAKARWDVPVVAIGGITLENAPSLIAAGADAIAVITEVFAAPDIEASARALAALFIPHVA